MGRSLPLAVLVSGEGTTLEALAEAAAGGHVPARIVAVVSDRPHAPAIERARRRGLATAVLPLRGTAEGLWSERLDGILRERGAELVLLAGFLSILPRSFVRAWKGRVVNLHPSLLPRHGGRGMYGRYVHEAVLAAGDAETGATVHLVTDDVDRGPVLEQLRVPVEPGDTAETLRERVRPLEQRAIGDVVRRFADGVWSLPYRGPSERSPKRERHETPSE